MNPEQTPAQPQQTPEEKRRDQIAASMRKLKANYSGGIEYFHVVSVLQSIADDVSDAEFRSEVRAALAALALVQEEQNRRQDQLIAEVRAELDGGA
ncbi:hypothetical protein ABGB07_02070 [Micromonosporaceae bacterium B7E4]